ncbi:hypothetical protein [uncultured Maribacter sp.]|uniref:hypothetical protein n=1 Tax=uncultured Maribacter sp. TaxID=431308 RepID=UPI002611D1DC|nr:hypothetical protein [uncultured Maribacter sp.]
MKKRAFKIIVFANLLFILGLLYSSCAPKMNAKSSNAKNTMDGVWKLSHFYHVANADTLITNTNKVQHKIYLNGFVIWNTDPAPDASEWHGFGTYTFKNDTITEVLTSMSTSMKSDVNTYVIPIEHNGKTYKQVNTYSRNDTIFKNIEVYKKLD